MKKKVIRIPPSKVAQQMKKAKIPPLQVPIRKGAWQVARETGQVPAGTPRTKSKETKALCLTGDAMFDMARDKAAGMSTASLSAKYGVSDNYVNQALNKLYVSSKTGREILKGVLLENALATGMVARSKVHELNGMQAIVASGIMTQRFIDLDKHTQNLPNTVDVSEVEKVGRMLNEMERKAFPDAVETGNIIDID